MSRHAAPRRTRRPAAAALAALLGVVVLASGQVTWAGWRHTATSQPGVVQAGTVGLSGTTVVELHSRQPAGTRTFQSTQSCTAPAPYVECRVVWRRSPPSG